ncbi:MAG: DNA topoisomerase IV subunit B [Acidimicrobiales bacterium]|nr:type IIA DNA topoisomerase subunit B [Acidimicrobiales bacterium]
MSASKNYDASHIEVLEGLEAVRKRPGMYIGGTGSGGLTHLLWEIIDNGVDEAAAGHCDLIEVTFHPDGSYEVSDNGRGIPIDVKKQGKDGEPITALEVVFTELHAGGKFGNGAYAASGGLHGVGASVVNALSSRIVVDVDRGGATHRLAFDQRVAGHFTANGGFKPSHKLAKVGTVPKTRTGTTVRFWPDTDIFDPEAEIKYEEARERVAQVCFLVPGLKIRLIDKRRGASGRPEEFVSKGGLSDYVEFLSTPAPAVNGIVRLEGHGTFVEKVPVQGKLTEVERDCVVDIALRWIANYDTNIVSFVNTIPTPDGGTHVAGFERALTFAVNDALKTADPRKLKKLKDNGKAQKEDVQEGLVAVVRATVPEPQFRGQTKRELGTPDVQKIVYEVAKNELNEFFSGKQRGTKAQSKAVLDKVTEAIVNRVSTKQALDTRRKAASLGNNGMPDKLADCRMHPQGELLIVEGDSAAGPAKRARDANWQAVLPLRGKVVNAGKGTAKAVLDNAEAAALFTAIGGGSGRDFDLSASRYERLVLLADADVDGSHIRCLVLTLVFHYMRPLLEAGRVYAAQPPTHSVTVGQTKTYVYSEAEKDAMLAELHAKGRNPKVTRFKGLGEMDDGELLETTLDPTTRVLRRITLEDAKAAERAFTVMMGASVEPRREFIIRHSQDYGHALDV